MPGVADVGLHLPVTGVLLVTTRLVGQLGVEPVEGETVVDSVTVPVNPLEGVIVMLERPVAPELKSAGDVALMVKSWIFTLTVALCKGPLPDPITVTV